MVSSIRIVPGFGRRVKPRPEGKDTPQLDQTFYLWYHCAPCGYATPRCQTHRFVKAKEHTHVRCH